MKKLIYSLTLCLGILLTVGCGFHLKKEPPLPEELHSIYFKSAYPYSHLTLVLKQVLRSQGIKLTDEPNEAQLTLNVISETYSSSTLSESASAATKEYSLTYTVKYSLLDQDGETVYGPKQIQTFRYYTVNEDQVISSTNELDVIHREMQRDALYQMLNQLGSEDVADIITTVNSPHNPIEVEHALAQ